VPIAVTTGGPNDNDALRHNATSFELRKACKLPSLPEFEKSILMSRNKLGLGFFGGVQLNLLPRVATIF
jgi:hypothetical protein